MMEANARDTCTKVVAEAAKQYDAGIKELLEKHLHEIATLTTIIEEHKLAEATAVENTQATTHTARCIGVHTRHDGGGTWVTKAAAREQTLEAQRRVDKVSEEGRAYAEQCKLAWDKNDSFFVDSNGHIECRDCHEIKEEIHRCEVREKEHNDNGEKWLQIIWKQAKNQHLTDSEQKEVEYCIRHCEPVYFVRGQHGSYTLSGVNMDPE